LLLYRNILIQSKVLNLLSCMNISINTLADYKITRNAFDQFFVLFLFKITAIKLNVPNIHKQFSDAVNDNIQTNKFNICFVTMYK